MGQVYSHLSLEERIEIYRLRCGGMSLRGIGREIGRSASTISRELGRNCGDRRGRDGPYNPVKANHRGWMRRRMRRCFKLALHPNLRELVRTKLAGGWSPEQISGWLALTRNPLQISHESIYRYIYHRNHLYRDHWHKLLPLRRYRRGHKRRRKGALDVIKHRHGVSKRCVSAKDRQIAGHWEADLMCFSITGPVLLIAHERYSRLTLVTFHKTKTSKPLMNTLCRHMHGLPHTLRQTIVFDNGTEFASHMLLAKRLGMMSYFCDPRSPWQKGGVENAILRLRRWLPRSTNITSLSKKELDEIVHKYNSTPRKCLQFRTPKQVFENALTVALRS
ncbi:IS30 family transposase [Flexibacterium corallicola]|uniref:IS30 family transposase n=1 Tax=Flexibacterium corallicola TaxID=3037259 RepID=UPI00286F6B01|nr:IS30 family transposase [Pseudovibrio sp. M1P-2-3]